MENTSTRTSAARSTIDWGSVKLVPAWHTNCTPDGTVIGTPSGLVIELGGKTIYHLGDTALFGDLRLIGERHSPDVALVPIGGHFTMDRRRRRLRLRPDRREDRDPLPLQHVPADRDRRRGVQATGRERDLVAVVILAPGESHEL